MNFHNFFIFFHFSFSVYRIKIFGIGIAPLYNYYRNFNLTMKIMKGWLNYVN